MLISETSESHCAGANVGRPTKVSDGGGSSGNGDANNSARASVSSNSNSCNNNNSNSNRASLTSEGARMSLNGLENGGNDDVVS